ncbi:MULTISPECIES: PAS domain S-box protein [unclassified Coleofasciculus]|uniref:PAS domain S-box protein n=1 Tax=unclassified Coleofasciculus TaxID=2692782 RepID=UPI001880E2B4|nr:MULTISPECIES: PAS domain S-box protein [unclassified Coleofasciculus]MBE9126513.1 PAS domain S-box protein [Coleofasciculus sp. LEGE 07081]MBE9149890.1 PAS domain S-box protein [Coleofasciculus sp. LEGE 07092]
MNSQAFRVLLVDDDKGDYDLINNLLRSLETLQVELDWVTPHSGDQAPRTSDIYLIHTQCFEEISQTWLSALLEPNFPTPVIWLVDTPEAGISALAAGAADYLPLNQLSAPLLERSLRLTYALAQSQAQCRSCEVYERVQVEADVRRQSEELHQIILGAISDAVFITDNDGFFTFICPNVSVIFSYSYPEVQEFGTIHHLLGDMIVDETQLQTCGELSNIERQITDKFGRTHSLLVNVKSVAIQGGTRLYTCHDITERKQAEAALQSLNAQLDQRVRERTADLQRLNDQLTAEIQERQYVEQQLSITLENLHQQNQDLLVTRQTVALERHRYQELFEFAPDGYFVTDTRGVIQEANQAAGTLLNVPQGLLVGKPLILYVTKADRHTFLTQLHRFTRLSCKTPPTNYLCELRLQPRKREPITVAIAISAIQNSSDRLVGLRWLIRDISDLSEELRLRQQAEAAIQALAERLLTVIDTVDEGITLSDEHGNFTIFNQKMQEITGYTAEEANACGNFLAVLYPDVEKYQQAEAGILEVMQISNRRNVETTIRAKDGTSRTLLISTSVLKLQGNLCFLSAYRNISDRKQAQITLQEKQRFIQKIADTTPVILYIFDFIEQRNVYVNREVAEFLGYTPQQIEAMGAALIPTLLHPEDLATAPARHQRWDTAQDGDILYAELRMRHVSGEWHYLQCHETLFARTADGKPQQILGAAADITPLKQVETELRQSKLFIETIADASPQLLYIYDLTTGKNIYVNRQSTEILGYTPTEIQQAGDHFFRENLHPDDLHLLENLPQKFAALSDGEAIETEYRVKHADGSWRWLNSRDVVFTRNVSGSPQLALGTAIDITDKKRVELELLKSEAKLNTIINRTSDGILIVDCQGIVRFANPAAAKLFNRTLTNLLDAEFGLPIIIGDTAELRIIRRRGELGVGEMSIVETEWQGESVYLVSLRDITERRRAEEALRESEQRFRQLADTIQDVFWLISPDTETVLYVSRAYETIWGLSCNSLYAQPQSWIDAIYPEDQEAVRAASTQQRFGQSTTQEYRIIRPDGEMRWICDRAFPIQNEHEEVYRIAGIAEDITERKQVEVALQQAKDAALTAAAESAAANRAKGEFLANISHELRTPLNAILGFTQLMSRDRSLSTQHQNHLNIITRSGEHLLALINDILSMSKIEAGRVVLQEKSFDLYRLLDTLEQMFQLKAANKGLQLTCTRSPNVPQYVRTDENKLRQVLINVLDNAMKFTEQGGISLQVESGDSQSYLVFAVKDTGLGIATEEMSSLFEPFVQTETGRNLQSGTGLGLAISRRFVRMMGGDMAIESVVAKGTTVKFEVKVGLAASVSILSPQPQLGRIAIASDQPAYRILIVEDNTTHRQLLLDLLQPLGFEVQTAQNGQQGVVVWENWKPHLIWMDMRMPVMDGQEATQLIRAKEERNSQGNFPATVIIAITASAFKEEIEGFLAAGCNDVVIKPVQQDVILAKIAQHLGVRYLCDVSPSYADRDISATPFQFLTSTDLTVMPVEWIAQLHQAARNLDAESMKRLIQAIPESHAPLGIALANLMDEFRFDRIMDLTQSNRL